MTGLTRDPVTGGQHGSTGSTTPRQQRAHCLVQAGRSRHHSLEDAGLGLAGSMGSVSLSAGDEPGRSAGKRLPLVPSRADPTPARRAACGALRGARRGRCQQIYTRADSARPAARRPDSPDPRRGTGGGHGGQDCQCQ